MSNWHPKPLRPKDPNPLFSLDSNDTYVVKSGNAIQRQREVDGSPHTKLRPSRLHAPQTPLYLDSSHIEKSKTAGSPASTLNTDPPLSPDAVVKAYLAKGDVKVSYHDVDRVDVAHDGDGDGKVK